MLLQAEREQCIRAAVLHGVVDDDSLRSALDDADDLLESLVNISLAFHHKVALIGLAADVLRGRVDGDLEGSKLIDLLNQGQLQLAAAEFQNWCRVDGCMVLSMYQKRLDEMRVFQGDCNDLHKWATGHGKKELFNS
jgi:hypothetical protein